MKYFVSRVLVTALFSTVLLAGTLFAQDWTLTSAPTNAWYSVACSADGKSLVAVVNPGGIYTSPDAGTNWTLTSAPSNTWFSVASSADGRMLAAGGGSVYTSTNAGLSWVSNAVPWVVTSPNGVFLASSTDGKKLVAGVEGVGIFTSTNAGSSWTSNSVGMPNLRWLSMASSADGTRLWGVQDSSPAIWVSTNSGNVWGFPYFEGGSWRAVATSADGAKAVGVAVLDHVYVTTNSGASWRITSAPVLNWQDAASSADGNILAASAGVLFYGSYHFGPIYISTDGGESWSLTSAPTNTWTSIASSADGTELVAVAHGGGIYTWRSSPTPSLNLAELNQELVLSWTVPSQNLALQETGDLATPNWTSVTSPAPILNLTNLQMQVALPSPLTNGRFYRLHSP